METHPMQRLSVMTQRYASWTLYLWNFLRLFQPDFRCLWELNPGLWVAIPVTSLWVTQNILFSGKDSFSYFITRCKILLV
jgi:hypothetical protein